MAGNSDSMRLPGPPHRARSAATTSASGSEAARSNGSTASSRAEVVSELDLWLTLGELRPRGPLIPLPGRWYSWGVEVLETEFAPAERAAEARVRDLYRLLSSIPLLEKILGSVPDILLFLNEHRQIVLANDAAFEFLGVEPTLDLLGSRPGEAFGCVHAAETAAGCGTTEFCQTCGAVQAILAAQRGDSDVKECRIAIRDSWDALDLRVSTEPFDYEGERLTICALQDISHEKRRRALERTFFHDVLNTVGGLRGFVELLLESEPEEIPDVASTVSKISGQLIEEIETQRSLLAAETNELAANLEELKTREILEELAVVYRRHEVAGDKSITIAADSESLVFRSDHALLSRVLGNMLKNALEATPAQGNVTLGVRRDADQVEFRVNNPAFMPRDVQLQVFSRSFSTKGAGRGIGTYSMRLLASRYLRGAVDFSSSEAQGTTFRLRLPRDI
jgi:signal transduction histidine kinase